MRRYNDTIYDLLRYHSQKLLLAKDKKIMEDVFERGVNDLYGWEVTPNISEAWHVMNIDTNEDQSAGLEGGQAVNTFGAWYASTAEKTVTLSNYGEISFEHYVKNDPRADGVERTGRNILRFYIDGQLKLEAKGPSPWYRCEPIGMTPGEHRLKFEYLLPEDNDPYNRKAVVDTITIYEAGDVDCLITKCKPPTPVKNAAKVAILRGFSSFHEMTEADTQIEFTAAFEGIGFHDFMIHADRIFYFVDEFGVCYRGMIDTGMEPETIAPNKYYVVDMSITAGQKTGVGFC